MLNRTRAVIVAIVLACGAVAEAAEYGGVVTGAGVPIPGATITATRADKQIVTTSDPPFTVMRSFGRWPGMDSLQS